MMALGKQDIEEVRHSFTNRIHLCTMKIMRILNYSLVVFVRAFEDCKGHDRRKVIWSKKAAVILVGLAPASHLDLLHLVVWLWMVIF